MLGQWNGMCKAYTGLSLYPYTKEKQARVSVVKVGGWWEHLEKILFCSLMPRMAQLPAILLGLDNSTTGRCSSQPAGLSAEAASKWVEHSDKMLCSKISWKSQDMWQTGVSLYCSFTGSGNASKYASQLPRTLGSCITGCWDVCVGGTRLCFWAVWVYSTSWLLRMSSPEKSLLADTIQESCIAHFTRHTYLCLSHCSPFFLTSSCCSLLLWHLPSCSLLAAPWLAYCFLNWILCKGFTQIVHYMEYYDARDLQDSLSLFCFTFAQGSPSWRSFSYLP